MFSVVLLLSVVAKCLAAEPTCSCSPFDYEEKLLTKMIRQEFMFEKFKDDISALQTQVLDKLKDIDTEREAFNMQVINKLKDIDDQREAVNIQVINKLKDIDDQREALKTEVSEERQTLGNDFKEMMDNSTKQMQMQMEKIQTLKDTLDADTVAFLAKDVSDTSLSGDQTFVYTNTILNEGNGYDHLTGQFTAPIGGMYTFNIQLCLYRGSPHYINLAIMADNKKIQGGYYRDTDSDKCYTADVLVRLESGGKVWVKCDPGACGGSMAQNFYLWNTFSGYRVHA